MFNLTSLVILEFGLLFYEYSELVILVKCITPFYPSELENFVPFRARNWYKQDNFHAVFQANGKYNEWVPSTIPS